MMAEHSIDEGSSRYTAKVTNETDLASPVTVTSGGYTVTFEGNNFATKHLRRIRRGSVDELTNPETGPDKLTKYITEAKDKSLERFDGRAASTNSLIYLDLGQYCQFGAQVIGIVKNTAIPWQPFGANLVLQKVGTISIGKCLAYSFSGVGLPRIANDHRPQGGVGIDMRVTIAQVAGKANHVTVSHYASGVVQDRFYTEYGDKKNLEKRARLARSIVS
ncbi:hypothetical protein ACVFYP_13995 [Roseomonas sp. F4]